MNIKSIHISNFKSFNDEVISFDRLNVLIGANAAGKSNVISLLRFFMDIINFGIDDAISMQGGMEYILNASIGKSKPIRMEINISIYDEKWSRCLNIKSDKFVRIVEMQYAFEITPHKRGTGYKLTEDTLSLVFVPFDRKQKESSMDIRYQVVYTKTKRGKIEYHVGQFEKEHLTSEELHSLCYNVLLAYFNDEEREKELIIHIFRPILPSFFQDDSIIKIFDFDPYVMKQASRLGSANRLEENGSNLANILQKILINKISRKRLIGLMKDFLPFFENIETEKNFDQSISYKIKEVYSQKKFYSNFLSDGTVNVLALIVALYFTRGTRVVILEEPERNLHPQLMRKLIEFAQDASSEKQIIITTHTPEIVKYTDIKNLIFAHRSKDGYTHIERPEKDEKVRTFLENDIGIDELFAQNMLGE